MKKLNIKNIINQNKKFGGSLLNKGNLEFDIDMANKQRDIYRSNAHVARAMTSGHSFLDGNKRTAAEILVRRFGDEGIKVNREKISKGMVELAKENVSNINDIEKRLKKWTKK
jgi:prophage maintenance system killer protein